MELQKGQKVKLADWNASGEITIHVSIHLDGGIADVTCFGVDEADKLSDERYFVFYNQTSSPEGAISMHTKGDCSDFTIHTSQLPEKIQKLVVTVAADGDVLMRNVTEGLISLQGSAENADYHFSGESFQEEKAVILCEVYRKNNVWRYAVVASGFNGGLEALLNHFGGQAAQAPDSQSISPQSQTPVSNPAPAPKVNLGKISLKKSGDTHKINLSKNNGQLHVNLNWNSKGKTVFGSGGSVDLDLACMFRLKTGEQGVIQALGNSFGSANSLPFIYLDLDDRSGAVSDGENMYFVKPDLIDFAIVFAYIYDGVPNWQSTDAKVVIQQQGSPDIEIHIDNPNNQDRFCVVASLSAQGSSLAVKREERFFPGHREVDGYYGFGFRWVHGSKD